MVQTSFTVSNGGSLTTVLQDISSGTDAAASTAYSITLTAAISLSGANVDLESGSSVTLEGPYPFIIGSLGATGSITTDLNFTGTITLDSGVLTNVARTINNQGTVVAGLYTGAVLGTAGDAGDTAINNGTISYGGPYAAIEFDSGTVENGWNGPVSALVSGAAGGVLIENTGLVENGGTIIAGGSNTAGVILGSGTVDNGQPTDTVARISGGENGVEITGAGVVNNDGTITGVTSDAVYIHSGTVTNGLLDDTMALIDGGATENGLLISTGVGTVANFGTITGGGASGASLEYGGTLTNGAPSDTTALVGGYYEGVLLGKSGSLFNYGTVQADGSDATQAVVGAFLEAGGTVENLGALSLVGGVDWGALVEGGIGTVTNLGTIEASGASGYAVDLTAGGTIINGLVAGSPATISGVFDGARISAGAAGAGADIQNDGTIKGAVGVDFKSGTTPAVGTLVNDGLIESTGGAGGYAVEFGSGAETLVLQPDGAFIGGVLGNNAAGSSTTLELASGSQGTLSGLGNDGGTVTDSAGSFVFSALGTITLDAGASWTVVAPGTFDTLNNAGALGVTGGAVSVSGSLTNSGTISIAGNTLTAAAGLVADQGVITVGAGGLLKVNGGGITGAGTSDIQVGGGSSATLNVTGAGATVNSNGYRIGIGSSENGSALVSQGGTLLAGTPFAADEAIYVGGSAGATGALTITDPGSLLRATGQFSVGLGGGGSLLIENQATVITGHNTVDASEGFDVGQLATASGEATVSGNKSLLSNTGRFVVGDAGLGSLSIQSGGTVSTTPGTVANLAGAVIAAQSSASGSSVSVTGPGSIWQISGALQVGNAATGSLSINAGATVTASTLDAGVLADSAGIVTVTGPNTLLQTTGTLSVGDGGSGEFSILNGANVVIGGDLDIGQTAGGSGNVDIEDTTGTVTIGGNLNIGAGGPGVLTVGPGATVQLDNGGVNVGPYATLDQFVAFDPPSFDKNTGNTDIEQSQTAAVLAYVTNTGVFSINQGVTYTLDTPVINGGPGQFQIGSGGSALVLNVDTISSGQTIDFTGAGGLLAIGSDQLGSIDVATGTSGFATVSNPNLGLPSIGGFAATINNFAAGDTITVDSGAQPATFSQSGSVVSVMANGTTLGVLTFATVGQATLFEQVQCFAAGTRLETARGAVAVEDLCAGERVVTAEDGRLEPVVWVGRRRVDCAAHPRPAEVWPIRVRAGAFGVGMPARDLWLSPDHAVFVNQVLVPVKHLVNGASIAQVERDAVVYYHVELPRHELVLAEGLAVESYLDVGDRSNFENGGGAVALFPNFTSLKWETEGCAPLVVCGRELAEARAVVAQGSTKTQINPCDPQSVLVAAPRGRRR